MELRDDEGEARRDVGLKRAFDGVLLDLFGTLVDFRSTFDRTLDRILEDNAITDRAQSFRDRWQRFVFQGFENGAFVTVRQDFERSLAAVLEGLVMGKDLPEYASGVITEMFDSLRVASLFPEVPEVLDALDREGARWAVVSNIDEEDLALILEHHGLRPHASISSERVGSYKPHSAPFRQAMDELGLDAARTLHAGDSPLADVAGAVSAGLRAAWVNRYGGVYPNELPRPSWTFHDLRPLPMLVSEG